MGITEIMNRKMLQLRVRERTGKEYYLVLIYDPRPGWMISRDMEDEMKDIWKSPSLLTPEKCNELEWKKFYVYHVPLYIRGKKKGTPKWEEYRIMTDFTNLRDAISWMKIEVVTNEMKIISSDPKVKEGAD